MGIFNLNQPKVVRRGRPLGSKNRPREPLPSVPLTQAEIDVLAEYAIGYPLEAATPEERRTFVSGMGKLQARRSK